MNLTWQDLLLGMTDQIETTGNLGEYIPWQKETILIFVGSKEIAKKNNNNNKKSAKSWL